MDSKPYTWVLCKPSVTVERWGILAITGIEIAPTSDASASDATKSFESQPLITGGAWSSTANAWCVAVEPIEAGKIGRVAVAGIVQLKAANLGKAAGAQVLYKNLYWSLIRMNAGIVRGTFEGAWAKGATKNVSAYRAHSSSENAQSFNVKNYFASVPSSAQVEKNCAIALVGGPEGNEWILIAAECA
jgi:predicted RecA/RadA family phage recombinase